MKSKRTLPVMASVGVLTLAMLACQFAAPAAPAATNTQIPSATVVTGSQPPISVQAPVNDHHASHSVARDVAREALSVGERQRADVPHRQRVAQQITRPWISRRRT